MSLQLAGSLHPCEQNQIPEIAEDKAEVSHSKYLPPDSSALSFQIWQLGDVLRVRDHVGGLPQ